MLFGIGSAVLYVCLESDTLCLNFDLSKPEHVVSGLLEPKPTA